jgi:Mlc titration factor MtfA (ptsG expression regulator)
VLAAEKEWTGCNGIQKTDEMRLTIAGADGVLILAPTARSLPRRAKYACC